MIRGNEELVRLRWQCRRGMLELDIILLNFFDHHYSKLDDHDKEVFQHLLKCNDQELYWWVIGSAAPADKELRHMVERIRQLENIHAVD